MREGLQLWREVEGRLITILGRGSPGEEADVSQPEVGSRVECVCVCVCVYVCVSGWWWWLTPGDEAGDEDVLRPRAEAQNSVQLSA